MSKIHDATIYKEFIGIRYKNRSFNAIEGLDCLTFLLYFYKTIYNMDFDNIEIPEYKEEWYRDESMAHIYSKGITRYCKILYDYNETMPLKLHSILFFSQFDDPKKITHAGIYINSNKFIHCLEKQGVCISRLTTFKRRLKLVGEVI